MTATRCAVDAPVALWMLDLSVLPTPDALATLSPEEEARAARFRAAEDARRYRAAHVGLRRLIADLIAVSPTEVRFAVGGAGKPRVAGWPALHVSLSYAGDRAMVGLSTAGAVGVDIERLRAIDDAADLALLHFSASEIAALSAVAPGPARDRAFLRGWTRKEACVKAIGAGLGFPTRGFTSAIGAVARRVTLRAGDDAWTMDVASIAIDPDTLAACAIVRGTGLEYAG